MKTLRMLFLLLFATFHASAQTPAETMYAITDVYVSHNDGPVIEEMKAQGFKPLVENGCVSPSSTSRGMADVNRGIGGDTVRVWIKYEQLPVTSDRKVLVDLVVANWPDWNVRCPAGFQEASGDARLTLKTDGPCNRNGLCVKYAPFKETENATIVSAVMLTRSEDKKFLCGPVPCVGNSGLTSMSVAGTDIHKNCGPEGKEDERVWVYICRNAERRSATTKTFASVTPAEKLRLLKTYAPRIHLAKDEAYFPSDVEWSFKYMNRYLNKDDQTYWLETKQPFVVSTTTPLDYWTGYADVSLAPVYAFWVDKSDGPSAPYVDLIYFTYYPYNLGKRQAGAVWGNHVGDWEHATVRLMWTQMKGTWVLEPVAVYVQAHDVGSSYQWTAIGKTSTHPILFAASGSHGLWTTGGSHPYKDIAVGKIVLADETSQGKAWDTWNRLIAWDYRVRTPLTGEPWPAWMNNNYSYAGTGDPARPEAGPIYRWGNAEQVCPPAIGVCMLENGPTGPPDKDVWRSDVFQ